MAGQLYIDQIDAYLEYGLTLNQGLYKTLVSAPPFKKINITDWVEEDGEEADLSCPVLDTRTFALSFCFNDKIEAGRLFEVLSDGAYHIFDFVPLHRQYKLRMVSNPKYDTLDNFASVSANFADDFPPALPNQGEQDEYVPILTDEPLAEGQSEVSLQDFYIDGIDLSRFGMQVLQGSQDSIAKAPDVKPNLLVNSQYRSGAKYDPAQVHYKAKDTTLKLLLKAPNYSLFWQQWNALLVVLLQSGERVLEANTEEYKCYYKSCKAEELVIGEDGSFWCKLALTLRFTDARPFADYYILATEGSAVVRTEEQDDVIEVITNR